MYSDENFEIRPEYREILPRVRTQDAGDFAEVGGMLIQGFTYLCALVVILFAAGLLAAIVGWSWTILKPQQLTERSQHVDIQEARGSSARPSGGERSSPSPESGRSTPTQTGAQTASENEVVLKEQGAAEAPTFYDESQSLVGRTRNNPRIIPAASALQVWGQDRFPGMVEAQYDAPLPDGSRGVIVWVPAGRTAGVHESTPGGTSLDQVWGPTLFVLRPNECVVSGSYDLCVMRGDSSQVH